MRRPPSHIPSATDRTPSEPRATPSVGGRVQWTVARSVWRRRNGRGRGYGPASSACQPTEHRLRDQAATAKRQEVCYIFIYFLAYCLYFNSMLVDLSKNYSECLYK